MRVKNLSFCSDDLLLEVGLHPRYESSFCYLLYGFNYPIIFCEIESLKDSLREFNAFSAASVPKRKPPSQ